VKTRPYDLDEALLCAAGNEERPQLAVYRFPEVAVVIGRGGDPAKELHQAAIADDGVPLLRRRGGGCAVVLDPGNLVVSVAVPLAGIGGISSAFCTLSHWLIGCLDRCGIPQVATAGVSDLILTGRRSGTPDPGGPPIDGQKIGGSCIWRTRDLLYYTTTLLVDPRFELMERYLRHPPREPAYRQGRSHSAFTTSLAATGYPADPESWRARLYSETRHSLPLLCDAFADLSDVASAGRRSGGDVQIGQQRKACLI